MEITEHQNTQLKERPVPQLLQAGGMGLSREGAYIPVSAFFVEMPSFKLLLAWHNCRLTAFKKKSFF